MNSPAKLTDTQFAILSEASQRKDRCLIPPKTLKGAAAQKVATKLLKAGLVREIKAKTGMEAWRRDEETGGDESEILTPSNCLRAGVGHCLAGRFAISSHSIKKTEWSMQQYRLMTAFRRTEFHRGQQAKRCRRTAHISAPLPEPGAHAT